MKHSEIFTKYLNDQLETKKEGNVIAFPVDIDDIAVVCRELYFEHRLQLKTITATDERTERKGFRIFYVFGRPKKNDFLVPYILLKE